MATKRRPEHGVQAGQRMSHMPVSYTAVQCAAVQAVAQGVATEEQQRDALNWIITIASGYYDLSYRPGGDDGRRESDHAEGRRFVGAQIVKMTKLDVKELVRREGNVASD